MADFISRDDAVQCANDLSVDLLNDRLDSASYGAQAVAEWLKDIPAADVVEVVRCKDCRYFYNGYDEKCCINHKGVVVTDENGFCHHAERRADDG